MSLVDDFQDLNLEDFFCERSYPSMPEVIIEGKSFDVYCEMLTQLKEAAFAYKLTLNPKKIYLDYEQSAIKAFKIQCEFKWLSFSFFICDL